MRITLIALFGLLLSDFLVAQMNGQELFREIILRVEKEEYSLSSNNLIIRGEQYIWFQYNDAQTDCELILYPNVKTLQNIFLKNSEDFRVVDSLMLIANQYYRAKIRFRNITESDFMQLNFSIKSSEPSEINLPIRLFPVKKTTAFILPKDDKLFIGEERAFKVETNDPNNIRFSSQWTRDLNINYKFSMSQGQLFLHLLPVQAGRQVLDVPLSVRKPFLNEHLQPLYDLPPLRYEFEVKESRLLYLNTNQKEFSLIRENLGDGIEFELDYHPALSLRKTYRIEAQEAPGGELLAEIFTRSILANGRVLCWLRPYNLHRQSEGYVYIKDGDTPRFISNFSISPVTKIEKISVLSERGNSSQGSNVFPGEQIEIRLSGQSLHKGNFTFDGLSDLRSDTLMRNENEVILKAKVPLDINKPKIEILNNGELTGFSLAIQEYQVPRPLDFVRLQIGDKKTLPLAEIDKVIYVDETLEDVVIAFDRESIDSRQRLYGKQYLTVDIVITDKNNNLIDKRAIENIVVCPGISSPCFDYYDTKNCRYENLSLNQFIRRKTHDLDEWSTIEITVSHDRNRYNGSGLNKRAEITLRRYSSFDLDVSFPAGLLTKKVKQEGYGTLSGISMAIIAQFSFYHPKRHAKYQPYKIGAGFLALNAFNFSANSTNRDVGVVALASLYPVQTGTRSKLSFPLYLGGGYFLSEGKFFFLLGPGIRLQL
jgi:hypothetical protein